MSPPRRWAARALDVLAVVIVVLAVARFLVLPRLHREVVQAPPVSLATLDGGRFDLERRRGHLVFLDFYATWCEPCRESVPMVQHFKRTHPGADVVSIDVGELPSLVGPFARRYGMHDVALDPDETVAHAFAVSGFPTMVAVDPAGNVRATWIGFNPAIERDMAEALTRYTTPTKTALSRVPPAMRSPSHPNPESP